jgi:hypothetical protein
MIKTLMCTLFLYDKIIAGTGILSFFVQIFTIETLLADYSICHQNE